MKLRKDGWENSPSSKTNEAKFPKKQERERKMLSAAFS